MRLARHVLLLALTAALAMAQSATDTTGGPDAREIRRLRELSNAAIARHDTAGFGAILAPNFVIVSSNSAHTTGRDNEVQAIAEAFQARPDVVYRRTPDEVRVFTPWAMASERGRWTGTWTAADGAVRIDGSYFAKWRRVNGSWRVETETFVPERCSGGAYCRTPPP